MQASVIIPTYNEAENLPQLLAHIDQIQDQKLLEILLIDGGSTDQTLALAQGYSLVKTYSCPQKGRAIQMNLGAHLARGDLLYFVHADTLPPLSFLEDIAQALQEGFPMGCYRFQFNSSRKILRINAYFTRFDRLMCRGGDQSLFITAQLFRELGGFKSEYVIMEEYDLLQRARRRAPFKIMPK
ncbi:MAG: TIGR04283 family arsenosugar biosynthesis glycosyltransferase, partial [Bacteroidota bacterium]